MTALSLIGAGAMAVQETELERIERELDILRTRRRLYRKWGSLLSVGIPVGAATIVVALTVTIWQLTQDPLYSAFFIVLTFALGLLMWFVSDMIPDRLPIGVHYFPRLVNIVRTKRRPAGLVPLYKSYVHPPSELSEIEEMIAWREKRLAELKGTRQ
jgi:hypothetical protein